MTYLQNHKLLSSCDLNETRAILADLNSIDTIDLIGRQAEVNATIHGASFGGLDILHASFGDVRIRIRTPETEAAALFMLIPTHGAGTVQHQGQDYDISPDKGLIRDMRRPLSACEDQFSALGIQLPTNILLEHCRTLLDGAVPRDDLVFDTSLDLRSPGGRHVRDTLCYLANALDGPLRNIDSQIVMGGLRDLLLTNILMLLPNSFSELLHRQPQSAAVPHYVKRARDYIHANADASITLAELVRHSGCGYRTLQLAFNEAYGMAPMAYVRSVRLARAHSELSSGVDGATVADVARKWGFAHTGRFAQIYMRRYGVFPSETLLRGH